MNKDFEIELEAMIERVMVKVLSKHFGKDNVISDVLTFEQGCQYLGYAKSYVYKLTSAGILPYSKPNGKSIFFDRKKLEDWMVSNASTSKDAKEIQASTYVSTRPYKFK